MLIFIKKLKSENVKLKSSFYLNSLSPLGVRVRWDILKLRVLIKGEQESSLFYVNVKKISKINYLHSRKFPTVLLNDK